MKHEYTHVCEWKCSDIIIIIDIFPGASVGIMPLPTYKWFMNSLIAMDKALVIAISCTASMVMVHSSWREIKSILQ